MDNPWNHMLFKKFLAKTKDCTKISMCQESGLDLVEENPFIGASPDSNVDCSCCWSGLLEVKCPSSIKREKSSHENLSFLTLWENDKVTLKPNHPFFYQVQGQMGVTGKNHSDFFVYTHWNSSGKNYTQSRNLEKYSSDIATFLVQISNTWNSITKTSKPSWKHYFTWPSPSSAWSKK